MRGVATPTAESGEASLASGDKGNGEARNSRGLRPDRRGKGQFCK